MTTPDVPAERGRDELRERLATTLAALVALRDVVRDSGELNGMEYDALGVQVNRAIAEAEAALLAPQEAPAEGISLSAQLSQAAAWMRVWDECQRLGMDTYGAPSTSTGLDIVLDFIRGRAAPQEAREPDGWAIRMRDGSCSTIYADRAAAERKAVKAREFFAARGDEDDEFDSIDVLPVYLGAPAPAEASEASDALRSAIEAMGDLHRALLHMGRGRLRAAEATERSES